MSNTLVLNDVMVEVSENTPYKPTESIDGKVYRPTQEQFTTPAGLNFDAHRNTSQEVLQTRAKALDEMADILNNFEPGVAKDTFNSPQSYEYMSSRLVQKTENLKVKADIAQVWVDEMVDEGRYASAVDALLSYNVPETDMPEMQNADYVGGLYQKAIDEGDDYQARRIAQTVVDLDKKGERDSLFKTAKEGSQFNEGWETRERQLFEKEIQETLQKAEEAEDYDWQLEQEVMMAYQSWNFREDGFTSDEPHPLAIDTGRAYAKVWQGRGDNEKAYQVAVESKLPQGDLEKFEEGLPKLQQLKARLKRHFSSQAQRVS